MKIYTYIITLVILNTTLGALAQDKKATEILDKLTENTQSYKTISVNFTYSMKNEDADINESFDGDLLIKGESYNLTIADQVVICDGSTLWTYIADAEEVQVNTVEDDDESITPTKLFTSYNDNYKSKFKKEEEIDGVTAQIIELIPNEGKSYSKIHLAVNKNDVRIMSFTIYDKNGSIYTYKVNSFVTDKELDDKIFVFNEEDYPDVEVIDMR